MPKKTRRIYTLSNKLSPEKKIVTFAKCSRSPLPFDEIANELNDEKTSQFNKRWVVGFGHLSVAEHGVLSIAMENVSILATKVIEDNRLASYTEKSTRYQVYDKNAYYKPKKIMNSKFAKIYEEAGDYLFEIYLELYPIINAYFKKKFPKPKDLNEFMYESQMKSKTCDVVRSLLPTATLTNLGFTVNARNLVHAAEKFISYPLDEMQNMGDELKKIAKKEIPSLAPIFKSSNYLVDTFGENLYQYIGKNIKEESKKTEPVSLVEYDKDAENKIIASIIYRYCQLPYSQIKNKVKKMSAQDKEKILKRILKEKGQLEPPIRELEHTYYTFDIIMDYGAFRDIQRHRMNTQTNQLVTVDHGYDIPEEIIKLGLKDKFVSACEKASSAYKKIAKNFPFEAQYIVPMIFKKRTLITMNLREAFHIISLRSRPAGHISYRRIASQMHDELMRVHPTLAKFIHVVKVK